MARITTRLGETSTVEQAESVAVAIDVLMARQETKPKR